MTGPVETLRDAPAVGWGFSAGGDSEVEPHLVWPEDQAWCLACDVDEEIEFTVGCSREASEALRRVFPGAACAVDYGAELSLYRDEGP